jgi:hypothetical protein
MAYAEFAGKSLPGCYHWYRAAELGIVSDILLLSNFGGEGPSPVGQHQGIGPYGTCDQAGNVREWAWSAARDERRFTLGGAWNDPTYLYSGPEVARPWDRLPTIGFRCAKYDKTPAAEALGPVAYGTFPRDYGREKPVSDAVFSAYRSLYAYDHGPLEARMEKTDDGSPHWRKETVSFAAGYGDERVPAQLYLPKQAKPPFQVVVYFPPSSAQVLRSSDGSRTRSAGPTSSATRRSSGRRTWAARSTTSRPGRTCVPTASATTASAWAPMPGCCACRSNPASRPSCW